MLYIVSSYGRGIRDFQDHPRCHSHGLFNRYISNGWLDDISCNGGYIHCETKASIYPPKLSSLGSRFGRIAWILDHLFTCFDDACIHLEFSHGFITVASTICRVWRCSRRLLRTNASFFSSWLSYLLVLSPLAINLSQKTM